MERCYGKPRVSRLLVGGIQLHIGTTCKAVATYAVRAVCDALRIGMSHEQSHLPRCRVAVFLVGVCHATIFGCNLRYALPSAELLLAACGAQGGEAQSKIGATGLG